MASQDYTEILDLDTQSPVEEITAQASLVELQFSAHGMAVLRTISLQIRRFLPRKSLKDSTSPAL